MPQELSRAARTLLAFYRGEGRTNTGYTLHGILGWDDDTWEHLHDFIQWVFPNERRSDFNPDAPTLTPELISLWASDPVLGDNFNLAFARWLRFVGLERTASQGFRFTDGASSVNRSVWAFPNHNWLRITRVLTCLRLLHHADAAEQLGDFLVNEAAPNFGIDDETVQFWRNAAGM